MVRHSAKRRTIPLGIRPIRGRSLGKLTLCYGAYPVQTKNAPLAPYRSRSEATRARLVAEWRERARALKASAGRVPRPGDGVGPALIAIAIGVTSTASALIAAAELERCADELEASGFEAQS